MDYLIRFAQSHETFRQPEIDALAEVAGLKIQWKSYSIDVRQISEGEASRERFRYKHILTQTQTPFAIISFHDKDDAEAASRLIARSILCTSIHEFWGCGSDHEDMRQNIMSDRRKLWQRHEQSSFRFEVDSYQGSRTTSRKREIIESCSYLPLAGPIVMKNPDCVFTVFEEFPFKGKEPTKLYLGRFIAQSGRATMHQYDLKKRRYISTTSMDAELSLITANLALAAPGKLAYDPFMGTGSFPVCCAHFGAITFGSDLDGRSVRGKPKRNVAANFAQYGTSAHYLGGFAADLTNTPLYERRMLDIIVCDPPYGVREGLKVLGHVKERLQTEVLMSDGTPAHLLPDYIAPRKPYSFLRMMDDILDFAALRLIDDGRLCMWMPVAGAAEPAQATAETDAKPENADQEQANGEEQMQEYDVPQHPSLQLVSACQQDFNKWSRRLLTYKRRQDCDVDLELLREYRSQRAALAFQAAAVKGTADDLNSFRKKYFEGFKT